MNLVTKLQRSSVSVAYGIAFISVVFSSPVQAETYFFHNDHLGTPQVVTDANQEIAWEVDQDPFGEGTITTNTVVQNIRFPGQYFDSETNTSYNYYRTYDASIGRYAQSDPLGLYGGANTYRYASGNPINRIDPYGLVDLKIPGATGQNSIHANPGPNATPFRAEHDPPHFHIGQNDGPRVSTDTFEPLTDKDAKKMTREQKRFCKNLSDQAKDLIRQRQGAVFKYGKAMIAIAALPNIALDSLTKTCQADPFFCASELPFVLEGFQ